ncbi:L-amino-acid oxidase [Plectosphaerella cucumerina]|uniref:L-amino-acid oxidase n=1 Tax=Plectosphaerella cucumerina TaxID=40658 RepID=A0A8K0TLI3_9PEZI|nr:L-amino-acid oxidase [Plectosphaerella cucumerina]
MTRWIVPIVAGAAAVAAAPSGFPVKLETRAEVRSRVANVHVEYERDFEGVVAFTYGPCDSKELRDVHHTILEADAGKDHRLVWVVPEDAESGGCLQAWDERGTLIGRSQPQELRHHWKRRKRDVDPIHMTQENGFSPIGAWFEGVKLLKDKQPAAVDVAEAKAKEVAIVGAGMSGLMTWLVLEQSGLTNVTILEASDRLGGRVRTEYLTGGPFDYSYQEMGPMRFPYQYTNPRTGAKRDINDQKFVYQLADEVNKLNGNSSEYAVNFIPWIQSNNNGFSYFNGFKLPSGLPPTVAQIRANASLGPTSEPLSESAQALNAEYNAILPEFGGALYDLVADNMFKAHEEWLENGLGGKGGDVWSEFAFLVNHLGGSLNDTDALGKIPGDHSYWSNLYNTLYFAFGDWRTIDGGLSRLPAAFGPLVGDAVTFGRRVERVRHHECSDKIELQWRDDYTQRTFGNATFDYAVVSAPFTVVRGWRLPKLGRTITNAINNLGYDTACKIALEYSERFWEHLDNPIVGGCSTTTDIPGVGFGICYPSYNINGTGPGTLLASYATGHLGIEWLSRSEEEHVQYILDAMTEIHGEETRALYTGKFDRQCWTLDPFAAGGWANPSIGQHQLYIPEYHKTHKKMIFVGEHTSVTHAWVSAAVESGIRGAVQLLLELGLVDEANDAVDKWLARWIDI